MKVLILGGTQFLGRHLVEAALAGRHQVTIFNRGRLHPDLFPEVEKLTGDRSGDLAALRGRRWDAVIDTCGYVPGIVGASAELLAGAVNQYIFMSSISVYSDYSAPVIDENSPVGTLTAEQVREAEQIKVAGRPNAATYGAMYGPLKVLCEQAAEEMMPGRVLSIRPGVIVGPHDYSDRFTYWVHRIARGGEVLAPGRPERRVEFIDARDLAEWTVRMMESNQNGVYNALAPDYPLTMRGLLETCKNVSDSDAAFVWVSEEFLIEQGAVPWTEIPLWIPEEGAPRFNWEKAAASGLRSRPLAETVRDTLAWAATRPADTAWRAGLTPQRETELLQAWRASHDNS